MLGKKIRINKLKNKDGFYYFLAMDHQLSVGHKDVIHDIKKWMNFVNESNHLSGMALNYGSLKKLPANFNKVIIPQMIGAPSLFNKVEKTQTIKFKSALRYSSDLFSLQINFENEDSLKQFNLVCKLINKCDSLEIPTLLMINLKNPAEYNTANFINYIKYCDEIGADLVKTPLPNDVNKNLDYLKSIVKNKYDLLLAGGSQSDNFMDDCRIAKKIGFKGLCVGRNIFESNNPEKINEQVCQIFKI
ncbi:MAG: hypothetical protein CR986_02975 [Ignavibacteriae bacterium]|nr:MAG: hypothetical protein CR986_02975 [Ignavibacteriota bacterium]